MMGYIRHDAIVVTGWDEAKLEKARWQASELGLPVSEIVNSPINGYCSFLIAPDGSKEGWGDSDEGDEARAAWKAWVRKQADLYLNWVHVSYAGDEVSDTQIVEHHMSRTGEEDDPCPPV